MNQALDTSLDHLNLQAEFDVGQASDRGVKPENEDSVGICYPEGAALMHKGLTLVIADGVSSAEHGKQAAESCVKGFLSDYYSTPDTWSVKVSVHRVLVALNRWLYGLDQKSFSGADSAWLCTLSILIIKGKTAFCFHVGDTRIYRLRQGELELLTRDHIRRLSRDRQLLSRAMGLDLAVDVDFSVLDVEAGDQFLLASDGMYEFVSRQRMQEVLEQPDLSASDVAQTLLSEALDHNSDDNLSCQVVKVKQLAKGTTKDAVNAVASIPFIRQASEGMVIDGYLLEKEYHASTRSQVFKVRDVGSQQLYCMKIPSVQFEDDPAFIERFVFEEWIASRVDSPHVVKLLLPGQKKSGIYHVSEWVDGGTLAKWIAEHAGKIDVAKIVEMVEQMAQGLRAMHRKEMLHQDIKPDNVLLADGQLKWCDFGSVFVAGIEELPAPIERDKILGTAEYSAPEYRTWRKVDERSEQFSLALIMYEMLTGKHPYGEKYQECKNISDFSRLNYVPSYVHNPLVPVWLDGALQKALSLNIDNRYPAFSEWLYDLKHPNQKYLHSEMKPWLSRDPLLVWKTLAAISFVINLILLFLVLN